MKHALFALIFLASTSALAQGTPPQFHGVRGNITGNGNCATTPTSSSPFTSNAGAIVISSLGEGSVTVDIANTSGNTWTGTQGFYLQTKQAGVSGAANFVLVKMTPVGGGAPVSSTTTNGQWQLALPAGFTFCVQGSNFGGSADVQINVSPAPSPALEGGTSSRSTQTATAPTQVALNGSTAVKVFAATAGVCGVTVCNEDAAIVDTCGQTNAVTANAKGLTVVAGACYQGSPWYGGDIWCVSASGTPNVGVQASACP